MGTAGVSAGTYVITASVTDSGDGGSQPITVSDTFTIVVTHEEATVVGSPDNPVSVNVSAPGGTATNVTICADITEEADGSLGSIANAVPVTFNFAPVVGNNGYQMQAMSGTVSSGTLQACVTLPSVAVNVYDVTMTIGGDYYMGSGSTVLAIFDPSLGFATGAGRVLNPNTGNIGMFGLNVKYLKRNTGAQGQFLYMEMTPNGKVSYKSNSMQSLSIVGNTAIVLGKATYSGGSGNYGFRVTAVDNGAGTTDQFGMQITTSGGAIVPGYTFPLQILQMGNISVPQRGGGN
jgi:hypothetical protein